MYIKYTSNQTEREGTMPWMGRVWPIKEGAQVVEINGSLHDIESVNIIEVMDIEKNKTTDN